MFKIKKGGWVFMLFAVLGLIGYGDYEFSRSQENEVRDQVNGHDIIGAFASRLQTGITRKSVETAIAGYKQTSIFEAGGETTVTYRFWYGFIPPLPVVRYKISGRISVTYSSDNKVTKVSHWYD